MSDAKQVTPLLPWWAGGFGIGLLLILAVGLVQPIGVSTQYVVLDGVLLHEAFPDLASHSAYLKEQAAGWTLATYEFFLRARHSIGRLSCGRDHQPIHDEASVPRVAASLWSEPRSTSHRVLSRRVSPSVRSAFRRRLYLRTYDQRRVSARGQFLDFLGRPLCQRHPDRTMALWKRGGTRSSHSDWHWVRHSERFCSFPARPAIRRSSMPFG